MQAHAPPPYTMGSVLVILLGDAIRNRTWTRLCGLMDTLVSGSAPDSNPGPGPGGISIVFQAQLGWLCLLAGYFSSHFMSLERALLPAVAYRGFAPQDALGAPVR